MIDKLNKPVYKYIESELSSYHQTRKDLEEALNDILYEAPMFDTNGGKSYNTGNPTENKAIRMVSNVRIRRMEKTIAAIEKVYGQLDQSRKKLVHLRYWQNNLTDPGVICELNVDRATYYRWKNNIIIRIGKELGY